MTATRNLGGVTIPVPERWHRPLMSVAAVMGALAVVTVVLAIVDAREILGQNAWFKPLKFAVSIAIYCTTLAWMISQLHKHRRLAHLAGTISAIALVIEIVIIGGAAAAGTTSHFNTSTPLHSTLWAVMAASIAIVWVAALVVAVALATQRFDDPARAIAIRSGVVLGITGMAVAFLMPQVSGGTGAGLEGISGAHAVGVPDGGAGVPFFGWSTEAGDLRVPHFVGMHLLQGLPLAVLALELLARKWPQLLPTRVRARLMWILAIAAGALLFILTAQALSEQSVVAPTGWFLASEVALGLATTAAVIVVVGRGARAREHFR